MATEQIVELPATLTVRELGEQLHVSAIEVIKELMKKGIMATINQTVEYDLAAGIATSLGFQPQPKEAPGAGPATAQATEEDSGHLEARPPVVTIMGHVDHGKTSLLDLIRETNVTAEEVGGITQHIGAYQVEVNGHKITFLDTPGHEAFTAMRARGARLTDIVVLVVAADDGIMPQTVEAIDHAKAAEVPIIVAINKTDLPDADPERVKQQLTEHGLVVEEWGGDVIAIPVSAKTKTGLQDLLEHILLVAEMSELKVNADRPAVGIVVEAEMDSSRGPMATVLVEAGTLRIGDIVTSGTASGKVKSMFNERGQRITEAPPSTPAKVMGLNLVPLAGDPFEVVSDEKAAREAAEAQDRGGAHRGSARTLEAVSGEIAAGRIKDLNVIVKADVQGSVEAIRNALERLGVDTVRVNVIHSGAGNVTESDTMLALASEAIIIAFQVGMEAGARRNADRQGVDIRSYRIIYELVEDLEKAAKGLLDPVILDVIDGHAEVRAVFKARGGRVAGASIRDGVIRRNSLVRVLRGEEVLHTSRVASLRRFQEDVREVQTGFECGIGVEGFESFQEGDVIEAYRRETQEQAG